jgi:hypothetical protein
MNNKTMNIIKIVTAAAFITWVVIAGINYAHGSSGLKVVVKLKYSDWIREHGMGKAYFNYYDAGGDVSKSKDLSKKFPKQVTLKFPSGAVDVGEGFTVILNSYVCDDATQKDGVNSPKKSPETIKMRFPC